MTRSKQTIVERQALILDKPQRIQAPQDVTDDMRALAAPPPGYGKPGHLPEMFASMLHAPKLLAIYRPLGAYLLVDGTLSPRDRELAILRVGWLCQSPYEWGEHVMIGKKAGLTTEEIERVKEGPASAAWNRQDGAVLQAVDELLDAAMISDTTWQTLAERLEEKQLIELVIMIGHYQGTAYYLNALRIRPREENPDGLLAR
jgi:alkylhydroperoxidase family enzyme